MKVFISIEILGTSLCKSANILSNHVGVLFIGTPDVDLKQSIHYNLLDWGAITVEITLVCYHSFVHVYLC